MFSQQSRAVAICVQDACLCAWGLVAADVFAVRAPLLAVLPVLQLATWSKAYLSTSELLLPYAT
jgi:hypothetical protein